MIRQGELELVLRRAAACDLWAIERLIGEARRWLRTKGTDQWARPWPGRSQRVLGALAAGRTWVAWDGSQPVATVTLNSHDHGVWPTERQDDPAVYVSRLVVSRAGAGRGLGAQLLDWAGLRALRGYGARWMRVDLWTTNTRLHDYYRRQGFEFCGLCDSIPGYPSAALFQKPADRIRPSDAPLFCEDTGS